ncbi:SUKH-4 family immunity protein [Streptomyces sp. NPDC048659]|uniref:SUKH-4 family immunity protein n=1 Tax=Streptomyces sp. NPDC048659 TaxID=3155489 RepID=UPI00343F34C8
MLIDIRADQVPATFGAAGVTYFPRYAGSRLHAPTAGFLATVGLPSGKLFSTKVDLGEYEEPAAPDRLSPGLSCRPSLQAAFDAEGAALPEEAASWEILGEFQYATVALDPASGKVYSFAEGEEFPVPMHADVSSLVHALIVVETGVAELRELPHRDDLARAAAVEELRARITRVDETPFASEDGAWSAFFEELALGMWG